MLEESPRDPAETRKRSPVPERWMWLAAGAAWGAGIGMLFGFVQGVYVYFMGDIQFYPEPPNRLLAQIEGFLFAVASYGLQGFIMGTPSGGAMSLVAGSLGNWPARYFVAALFGVFVPPAVICLIGLSTGAWWGPNWQSAMVYFSPIGFVAALLATSSVRRITLRAAKKREEAADRWMDP